MMGNKRVLAIGLALIPIISLFSNGAVGATGLPVKFEQNNIIFYTPACTSGGASVCTASLPSSTIKTLEDANAKQTAEKNMERYKYAEEKTKLPWSAIAALHWREAGMSSDASISNGENLTTDGSCFINVDGLQICGDPNKDAEEAAKHLIYMAKIVYEIDLTANSSTEDWAKAFLAYNRGFLYEQAGATYDTSPYVMNGFDEQHLNMSWGPGDTVSGVDGNTVGALAAFAYFCGTSGSGNSSPSTSTTSSSSGGSMSGANKYGLKYYNQGDFPQDVGTGDSIAVNGCGPTSYAMLAGYQSGTDYSPIDVGKKAAELGVYVNEGGIGNMAVKLSEEYGFESKELFSEGDGTTVTEKIDIMNKMLTDGWSIHVLGGPNTCASNGGNCLHEAYGGHFIGVYLSENGKWFVADSGGAYGDNSETPYDPGYIARGLTDAVAIKGNGNKNSCSTTGTAGFKDIDTAEKVLIEPYKKAGDITSLVNTIPDEVGQGGKANCVGYSKWWLYYFTTISQSDIQSFSDDGAGLVQSMKNALGSKYPKIVFSDKPSVYAIASWDVANGSHSANHTGVVVGINGDKILIAEAGWNDWEFTGVKEYPLSDFNDQNSYMYANVNDYLKPGAGLQ